MPYIPKPNGRWTAEQNAKLIALWKTPQPVHPFAQSIGRTVDACKMQAHKLGCERKPHAPWGSASCAQQASAAQRPGGVGATERSEVILMERGDPI